MKDALFIKTHLDSLKSVVENHSEAKSFQEAKIQVTEWLYNNGELRNESEIETKLNSIKEEILICEFAENTGIEYKKAQCKLTELVKMLSD